MVRAGAAAPCARGWPVRRTLNPYTNWSGPQISSGMPIPLGVDQGVVGAGVVVAVGGVPLGVGVTEGVVEVVVSIGDVVGELVGWTVVARGVVSFFGS